MDDFLNPSNGNDLCSLLLLIGVLLFLGSKMVRMDSGPFRWAKRVAAAAAFLTALSQIAAAEPSTAGDFLEIVLRALFVGGLVLGVSWLLFPPAAAFYRTTIGAAVDSLRHARQMRKLAADKKKAEREAERQRLQRQIAFAAAAPERERLRQEAEQSARTGATAQKRREDARASCELLFSLYAPDIQVRFSRADLDAFMNKYMSDGHAPEYVEQRWRQLAKIIEQHREAVGPLQKKTLEELARWYQDMRQNIDAQQIDERRKNAQVALLNARYQTLVQELLEDIQP